MPAYSIINGVATLKPRQRQEVTSRGPLPQLPQGYVSSPEVQNTRVGLYSSGKPRSQFTSYDYMTKDAPDPNAPTWKNLLSKHATTMDRTQHAEQQARDAGDWKQRMWARQQYLKARQAMSWDSMLRSLFTVGNILKQRRNIPVMEFSKIEPYLAGGIGGAPPLVY